MTADVGVTNTDNNGGGGIYMDAADLTITNSTVSSNTVTVNGATQSEPADGGGGIYHFGDNMRLQNSTVSGNVAHGPRAAPHLPGACRGDELGRDDDRERGDVRTGAKLRPGSLGAQVKPHSDAKAPFVFKVSGKLKLPSGVSRATGCRGSVSLKALVGRSKVGGARSKVGRLCGYQMKVTLHGPHLGAAGMARLLVTFGGNTMLASSKAAPLVVHFG